MTIGSSCSFFSIKMRNIILFKKQLAYEQEMVVLPQQHWLGNTAALSALHILTNIWWPSKTCNYVQGSLKKQEPWSKFHSAVIDLPWEQLSSAEPLWLIKCTSNFISCFQVYSWRVNVCIFIVLRDFFISLCFEKKVRNRWTEDKVHALLSTQTEDNTKQGSELVSHNKRLC